MSINTFNASGVQLSELVLTVYSKEIAHQALPVLRFSNFAVQKTELSALPGQKVMFTKMNNLTRGTQLTENVDLVPTTMSATQSSIEVREWGNAVSITEALLRYSYDALLVEAAYLLARDYAVVRDLMNRDALASTTIIKYAGAGTALSDTTAELTKTDILKVTETLATKNAPAFIGPEGEYYIGFIHPHQATSLKDSKGWENAQLYAGAEGIFRGEIGRMDGVRFIRSTHVPNGAAASTDAGYDNDLKASVHGGSKNLYRALFFGDNAFGEATALPVEMRHDGVQNFGRRHSLAWYTIMGADLIEEPHTVALITA